MTIRNRLALISSATFGVVFTVSALLVYYAFYTTSERIIFSELEKTCMLAAMFYLEEDELSAREHRLIRNQFEESILQAEVKIYDANDQITFGNVQMDKQVTAEVLNHVRREGKTSFKLHGQYYYGMFYPDNQGDFVVFITTNHTFFDSQSNQLLLMLGVALVVGLGIIFLLSFWLSRIAYKPVSNIIRQVNQLEAESLETVLISPNTRDELQDLVDTFNDLLRRLSDTFVIQRNFINYVSHEFKTPLAAISGNLEVFAQKERSVEEYQIVSKTVLEHVYQIEQLLNDLMLLAGLRAPLQDKLHYRVDELLWSVLDRIYTDWPVAKELISLEIKSVHAEDLTVSGNVGQLEIALFNLVENALKYSEERPIVISLTNTGTHLALHIKDQGKGIDEEELKFVHQPFYRGSNVRETKGSGIGLSLAVLICRQNGVGFSISSEKHVGTVVELCWTVGNKLV